VLSLSAVWSLESLSKLLDACADDDDDVGELDRASFIGDKIYVALIPIYDASNHIVRRLSQRSQRVTVCTGPSKYTPE
jgi:hypothetical protein